MATWYVNSAVTGSTGSGTSWANATATLALAVANASAGDDFNIVNTHNETISATTTITWPNTSNSPCRIFSCNQGNSPAQASNLVAGAKISVSGAFTLTFSGVIYVYGLSIAGATSSTNSLTLGNGPFQVWDTCAFSLPSAGGSHFIIGSSSLSNSIKLINCSLSFVGASQTIEANMPAYWQGGSINVGVNNVFQPTASQLLSMVFDGVDMSAQNSGLILTGPSSPGNIQFNNCFLNGSATISGSSTTASYETYNLISSQSNSTIYRQEKYNYAGQQTASNTIYNNATDGSNAISWQIVSGGGASRQFPFETMKIVEWVPAGTYGNCYLQATSAISGLTNADIWLEASYMGNSTYTLGSRVSGGPATVLSANTAIGNTGTWTTGSLGNNYKITVPSFTTTFPGYVRFTIKVAKTLLTIYVDPAITVAV